MNTRHTLARRPAEPGVDPGAGAVAHPQVRATRPVCVAVLGLLAAGVLGPQSLRFASRDAGAVLEPVTALAPDVLVHAVFILAGAVLGSLLVVAQPVRSYWKAVLAGHRVPRNGVRVYLLWLALCGVSVLWSVAPAFTVISWARLVGLASLTAVWVALSRDRYGIVRFLWWFSAAKIVAIASFAAIDPSLVGRPTDVGFRLTGGILPDFGISGFLLVACSFAMYSAARDGLVVERLWSRRWVLTAAVLVGCGFTLYARSRYTVLTLLAVLALVAWAHRAYILALLGGAVASAFLLVDVPGVADAAFNIVFRGREGLTQLSARDVAFQHVMSWSADDRLLGAGYAAGSRTSMVDFMRETGIKLGSPHDAVSTVVPDLGLVGVVALSLVVAALVWGLVVGLRSLRVPDLRSYALFTSSLVLLAFAGSVASTGVAGQDVLASVPIFAVAILGSVRAAPSTTAWSDPSADS